MSVFIVIWSLWFISELFLNIFLRSPNRNKNSQDKGSLRIIWITLIIVINIGVFVAKNSNYPISKTVIVPYTGLSLIIVGMLLRFIAIRSLGKFFTVDVAIHSDHKIIQHGLYKIIRHPAYSGSLLSFVGFGISLNNWISLIIIAIPVAMAFIHRIKIEEKLLLKQFGEDYEEYMKKTYRLVPMIY